MIDPQFEYVQRRKLRDAVGNMRLMGIVFGGLGAMPMLLVHDPGRGIAAQILAMVDAAILIGPGVWYFFGAHMIRNLQMRGVRISMRVAVAQMIIIALSLILGIQLQGRYGAVMVVPALIACFFVPALIAMMVQITKARGLIRLLDPEIRAFEAIPVATIVPTPPPLEGDGDTAAAQR